MKLNWFVLLVFYVITQIIIIGVVYNITKKNIKPIEKEKVIKVIDTIKVKEIKIIKKPELRIIKDTILAKDTSFHIASVDTMIDNNNIKIDYYFPPVNKFEVELKLKEKVKTILDTIVIDKVVYKRNYYEEALVFLAGIIIGLIVD